MNWTCLIVTKLQPTKCHYWHLVCAVNEVALNKYQENCSRYYLVFLLIINNKMPIIFFFITPV